MPKVVNANVNTVGTNGVVSATVATKPKGKHGGARRKAKATGDVTGLAVKFPDVKAYYKWGQDAITYEEAKEYLGWETEPEYIQRMKAANPDATDEQCRLLEYTLRDSKGLKVMCANNRHNRPFEENHGKKLAQSILKRTWAGPTSMPGETVNGESVIITRTGQVASGQHRLIGLVLAYEMWEANPERWGKYWDTPPVLESVLVVGISDSPKVISTLDNVKTRKLSDVFYTCEIFRDMELDNVGKYECSKNLEKAVDFLWKRTAQGSIPGQDEYQTHSTSLEFLDRHPKLLECVRLMFTLNRGDRKITSLKLSPGECAGMMYLMTTCGSNPDDYRNADPPNEKVLSVDQYENAELFFTALFSKTEESEEYTPVRDALKYLGYDETTDKEGYAKSSEKTAVIAKSWNMQLQGLPFTTEGCRLQYQKHPKTGEIVRAEWPNFGGIDVGDDKKKQKEEASRQTAMSVEERAAEERKKREEFIKNRLKELNEAKKKLKAEARGK